MANRVMPISSSDQVEEGGGERSIPISYSYMRDYLTDATFSLQSKLTFANFKLFLVWFLDTARLSLSFSVSKFFPFVFFLLHSPFFSSSMTS
jgi:hypothetical protein